MKKRHLLVLPVLSLFSLIGCSSSGDSDTTVVDNQSYNTEITVTDPEDIVVSENTGAFSITSSDGSYSNNGNIYTLSKAGTYTLKGKLDGQILVEAGSNDEVVIELDGASINYDKDSPIKALTAGKVEISAKKDSGNTISDNRSAKTVDSTTLGEGAIYAKTDLKLKGSGTLVVTGNYNNGIHTTKDLDIQKLSMKVVGYSNALKGNNSVTITSGVVQAYAKTGNGIKTQDNDVTSSGKQKGTISINGGSVYVNSLRDAVDASYNLDVNQSDSSVTTQVTVVTGTYSSYYSKSTFQADSEKGFKALNDITINDGTVTFQTSDDAIHANYGESLGNGSKGNGNLNINGGVVQVASGDDGLHADNTLNINGGKVVVTNASEGFEGNYINITGGYSYIYGTDDGVNCSKKSFSSCAFTMSSGYLDVAVKNGDTDGIDSNGNFTLSGGVIITRGSAGTTGSGMSTGLDVDGTCSMTGGTLIAFNGLEKTPTTNSNVLYAGTSGAASFQSMPGGGGRPGQTGGSSSSSVNLQAGNYSLSGSGMDINFTNDYVYGSFLVYSSSLSTGSTYTLSRNDSSVLSWNQSSSSVTIS